MTFRAGIIGTGGIAGMGILGMHDEEKIGKEKIKTSHAGGYDAAENIELVAIADVDKDKLAKFGEAWEIPRKHQYTDHQQMLEIEDLDVVSVCTPSYRHHDHVLDAAQSASNPSVIWCEKPIASSVAEAEEMCDVCSETDTDLVINHSFRFTSKLRKLRSLIQEQGILGNIHSVSTQFRMELMRNSTHLLDTLVYLLDSRAERVSGYINGKNEAVESLEAAEDVLDAGGGGYVVMEDGTFITVDCTIPRDHSSMTLQFLGSEGKLYLNNDDGEWRYWRIENGEHVETDLPDISDGWTWEEDYTGAFVNAATNIERMLTGDAENPSTGKEATRSLELIVGFYISHFTGSTIDVPLEPPLRDVTISSW
jgi:predicted dehydrogenase